MVRYLFKIYNGEDVFDSVGTELVGLRAIRSHMVITATALIEEDHNFPNSGEWEMEAVNTQGKIVCTTSFAVTKEDEA